MGSNADYIVDGMCRQLRQLEQHPNAPQLFAVLLQEAGVAPQLLPLLAEPARSALQGLSILARRQQPQHVLAFLQALGQIAAGADSVVRPAAVEVERLASDVRQRWDAHQAELEAELDVAGGDRATGVQASRATMDEIGGFVSRQRQQRQAEQEGPPGVAEVEEQVRHRVGITAPERERLQLAKRRVHGAAVLAQSIADCSNVLVLSRTLPVAVQALGVCLQALRVLQAATLTAELDQYQIQPLVRRRGDMTPADPEIPRLLPSVHLLWQPVIGALKVGRARAAVNFYSQSVATLCPVIPSRNTVPVLCAGLASGCGGGGAGSAGSAGQPRWGLPHPPL